MEKNWLRIENKAAEDKAEIFIEGTIGSYWKDNQEAILTKEEMQQQMKRLAEIKAKLIVVHINSYGGDVNHGVSIHDLLANSEAEIITIVNGHTASAATIIAQAGNVRKMSANALYLVHNASTIAWGNKNELKVTIDDLEKVDTTLANIYAKRTGKPVEDILAQMNKFNGRGEWMTADEAKAFGIIDEVYEPMKAVASIDKDILMRFGLPEIPENKITNPIKNNMKKIALLTMAAIAAFFGKQTTEELEINQEDLQKLNDELHTRSESITALTAERDLLKAEAETFAGVQAKAEEDLATANQTITDHEATISDLTAKLEKKPGAESSKTETKKDNIETETFDIKPDCVNELANTVR